MHTTNCVQPPSFIGYELAREVVKFIKASHIKKVIQMPAAIAKGSLIGEASQAVSVEISNSDRGTRVLDLLAADIARYQNNEQIGLKRDYYSVVDKIMKSQLTKVEQDKLQNFEPFADGFVPVLTGENSYKAQTDYLGFRAIRLNVDDEVY